MAEFPSIPISVGSQPKVKARVNTVELGSGYKQRSTDEINNIHTTWNLKWKKLDVTQKDEIISFLEWHRGVQPFQWKGKNWVCATWSYLPDSTDKYDVSATFEEDFNL